jgi:hypothetical protein
VLKAAGARRFRAVFLSILLVNVILLIFVLGGRLGSNSVDPLGRLAQRVGEKQLADGSIKILILLVLTQKAASDRRSPQSRWGARRARSKVCIVLCVRSGIAMTLCRRAPASPTDVGAPMQRDTKCGSKSDERSSTSLCERPFQQHCNNSTHARTYSAKSAEGEREQFYPPHRSSRSRAALRRARAMLNC